MDWQDCNTVFEDSNDQSLLAPANKNSSIEENEQKKQQQLHKLQDPAKDVKRQSFMNLMSKFNDLLVNHKIEELAHNLLTEDCQIFHFVSTERYPGHYVESPKGFISLYKDMKVLRRVRQSFVDTEKSIGFQLCNCRILYEKDKAIADEVTFEAFSITNGKVSKYRICIAQFLPIHGNEDPFKPTRKDRMLAKVKEINYAFAGKPDLDKIASLLHDKSEYRIWGWGADNFSTLYKHNFATSFRELEKDYIIDCVVPYELSMEGEYIVSTYVYYLEGKHSLNSQRFLWFSTSAYEFDRDINITQVNQQGELFHEDESPPILFEVYPRNRLSGMVHKIIEDYKPISDAVYKNNVNFNIDICQFGAAEFPDTGRFKGISSYMECLKGVFEKKIDNEWVRAIDSYVDCHDPSYDAVIVFLCSQITFHQEGFRYNGKRINLVSVLVSKFENGKLSKMIMFLNEVPEDIPSPFDDPEFQALHIKQRKKVE